MNNINDKLLDYAKLSQEEVSSLTGELVKLTVKSTALNKEGIALATAEVANIAKELDKE